MASDDPLVRVSTARGVTTLTLDSPHNRNALSTPLMTGLLGATWGVLYLTRRSAIAPITSHAMFNLGQIAAAAYAARAGGGIA